MKQNMLEASFRKLTNEEKVSYHNSVKNFYERVLEKSAFSGGILVAKNGEIVFEAYNGYANWRTKEPLTANTPMHIASVSKTLTGMAIVRLLQQGKLKLEDSLQQYFPAFPYHGITLHSLLTHRSGLPNYAYFMDTAWNKKVKATNNDMLDFMIAKQPRIEASPNKSFHYCNTNFALLALVVEKVTSISFPTYMKYSVFIPLGMKNTFVFSVHDTANYTPSYTQSNTPFQLESLDCIYGDKNIYSTVQDLLLWDKAMYTNNFIQQPYLQKSFLPYSNERFSYHNYGLGWRLYIDGADTTVYHNGWWHGNNAVFARLIGDTATIITLGNKYNHIIYSTRKMASIFSKNHKEQKLKE